MNETNFKDVFARADCIHSRAVLDAAILRMGAEISHDYSIGDHAGGERLLFLTLMHGGMIFAAHLAVALTIDVELDYLHATRYRGQTSGGELRWIKPPQVSLKDRRMLLVDDILDEGKTLLAVRDYCQAAGAAEVRVAVLCEKAHARRVPGIAGDYVGVTVPDRYVFGFGMDYHEQGRNLPAIYAI